MNRAEALKILLGASGQMSYEVALAPFADVDQTAWYASFINYAYTNGVVSGMDESTFAPEADVTRAEMSKMAVKLYQL